MNQIFEEVLPFLPYFVSQRKLLRRACDPEALSNDERYERYAQLDGSSLDERIREEHDRANQIDEKTTKFTLSFSIGFSVIGVIGVLITRQSSDGNLKQLLVTVLGVATFYTIVGGLIALGSLKTLPKHGYGTQYRLSDHNSKKVKVSALAAQETVNTVRHLRNEAAYQCLRNGLICLVISIPLIALNSSTDAPHANYQSAKPSHEQGDDHSLRGKSSGAPR